MARLDKERQERLEPVRMQKAIDEIKSLGLDVTKLSDVEIQINTETGSIRYFPYSGWATGKCIEDGRGLKNLLSQLKRLER